MVSRIKKIRGRWSYQHVVLLVIALQRNFNEWIIQLNNEIHEIGIQRILMKPQYTDMLFYVY